jgi:hypothetical protein
VDQAAASAVQSDSTAGPVLQGLLTKDVVKLAAAVADERSSTVQTVLQQKLVLYIRRLLLVARLKLLWVLQARAAQQGPAAAAAAAAAGGAGGHFGQPRMGDAIDDRETKDLLSALEAETAMTELETAATGAGSGGGGSSGGSKGGAKQQQPVLVATAEDEAMHALSVPVVLVHFDEEVPGAQYLLQQWQVSSLNREWVAAGRA